MFSWIWIRQCENIKIQCSNDEMRDKCATERFLGVNIRLVYKPQTFYFHWFTLSLFNTDPTQFLSLKWTHCLTFMLFGPRKQSVAWCRLIRIVTLTNENTRLFFCSNQISTNTKSCILWKHMKLIKQKHTHEKSNSSEQFTTIQTTIYDAVFFSHFMCSGSMLVVSFWLLLFLPPISLSLALPLASLWMNACNISYENFVLIYLCFKAEEKTNVKKNIFGLKFAQAPIHWTCVVFFLTYKDSEAKNCQMIYSNQNECSLIFSFFFFFQFQKVESFENCE